jgi:hypothetical protein
LPSPRIFLGTIFLPACKVKIWTTTFAGKWENFKPMLQLLMLDELTLEEVSKVKKYLSSIAEKSPIENLFWIKLKGPLLTKEQLDLKEQVGVFKVAIEVGKKWIRIELLLRSEALDNRGGGLLTEEQFNYVLKIYNNLCKHLM